MSYDEDLKELSREDLEQMPTSEVEAVQEASHEHMRSDKDSGKDIVDVSKYATNILRERKRSTDVSTHLEESSARSDRDHSVKRTPDKSHVRELERVLGVLRGHEYWQINEGGVSGERAEMHASGGVGDLLVYFDSEGTWGFKYDLDLDEAMEPVEQDLRSIMDDYFQRVDRWDKYEDGSIEAYFNTGGGLTDSLYPLRALDEDLLEFAERVV